MAKLTAERNGFTFKLSLDNLTTGKLLALTRALTYYNSPVGNDVLCQIRNAISATPYNALTKEIEDSIADLIKKMQIHGDK